MVDTCVHQTDGSAKFLVFETMTFLNGKDVFARIFRCGKVAGGSPRNLDVSARKRRA